MISVMNESAIRSDWVGRVMDGRFTLLQWLGGSERSAVFLTEFADGTHSGKVVIKVISADAQDAEVRLASWRTSAHLSHPNMMRLFATGECEVDGFPILYAVTEYADEVLADILTSRPLSPEETGQMLGPVLDALAWIHGKGFVHGHVKPSNIMVVDDQLKLSSESLLLAGQPGTVPASPGIYDAPESVSGSLESEADLWSLGVTLVETLTQRRPAAPGFQQDDLVVPSNLPEPYATIARGCLRADPLRRFTIPDIRNALGIGHFDPDSAEETSGKVPALARLGILVVPLIVISAAFAVHEVNVHMRGVGATSAVPAQAQTVGVSSEQKPLAGTRASTSAPEPQAPETGESSVAAQTLSADRPSEAPSPALQPVLTPSQRPAPAAAVAPVPAPATRPADTSMSGSVVSQVMPDILPAATRSIHGKFTVRIRADVDAAGNVSSASYDSEGPSKYFAKQALEASQHWKFKAASGPSHWVIQYVFRSSGTEVTSSQTAN
jgi:serine/threonine-protein kinase